MKKLLPIILACLCWCGVSYGQMTNVSVDQIVHDGSIPILTGKTTYRVFVNTVSETDFLTSVSGGEVIPSKCINPPNPDPIHASELLSGISGFLLAIPGFEDLKYSSGVTVGNLTDLTYGTPITGANPDGAVPGSGGLLQYSKMPMLIGLLDFNWR